MAHAAAMRVAGPIEGVLCDLLMAVMDSPATWAVASGDVARGLAWRDAVTRRMAASDAYQPYEALVAEAATDLGLAEGAPGALFEAWRRMEPWPDASALDRLDVPYAFVTNCSAELARLAAGRSGLVPAFTLSAEEAGRYKPDPAPYHDGCRRLRLAPARVAFVAGSAYDADGARAAGLRAWFVRRRPDQGPRDRSVRVASSLDEVVAAIGREAARLS